MFYQQLLCTCYIIFLPQFEGHPFESNLREARFTGNNDACQTPECTYLASLITKNINPSVNPCDDFYSFACGNIQNNVKFNFNLLANITQLTLMRVRLLLTNGINDSDIPPLQMAKKFYNSCVRDKYSKTDSFFPIYEKMQKLGGWPVQSEVEEDMSSLMPIIRKARSLGFESNSILSMYILPDAINTDTRRLVVAPPVYVLPVLREDKLLVSKLKYFDMMMFVGLQFLEYSAPDLSDSQYESEKDKVALRVSEVLGLELALVDVYPQSWNEKDIYESYDNVTINEAQQRYPFINWLDFLQSQLGSEVQLSGTDYVIITGADYFRNSQGVFAQTSKRIILNYMIWRYILFSMRISLLLAMNDRWKYCVSMTISGFDMVLSPKYIRTYVREENRKPVVEMVLTMKKIMYNTFSNYKWIDPSTKKNILDKIDGIIVRVGYSEEMLSCDDKYTELYSTLQISSTDYYNSVLNVSKFILDFVASTLPKPINKHKWPLYISALTVNAFYVPIENSITIPAALLQEEIYSVRKPQFWNYGTVGFIIGHELSHALDNMGRNFDKNGVRNMTWWPTEIEKIYDEKSRCFVDQFNSYSSKEIRVDGETTLGENIADSEGISKSYEAYQSWISDRGQEKLLPRLKYTPQQLFWISSANLWCVKQLNLGFLPSETNSDPHAHPKLRVIGMVSNQKAFAKDFSCHQYSNMNPSKKCTF